MVKKYYIAKSVSGCFGGGGTVSRVKDSKGDVEYFTSKRKAERRMHGISAAPPVSKNKGILYWVDFDWA